MAEKELTGYKLTSKMRKTRRRNPLSTSEQALYNELVAICNDDDWEDPFNCSNAELCGALRISENTLVAARNRLTQVGLLFYRSGKHKKQHGTYSFKKTIPVLSTSKNEGDVEGVNEGDVEGVNEGDVADNIEQTKTKLKPIPFSNEKGPLEKPPDVGKNNNEKVPEKKSLYVVCIEKYDQFIMKMTDNGAKIDGAQGNAMKNILAYLQKQVKAKNKNLPDNEITAKVIESWCLLLDNWHYLTDFLQKRLRLVDINSELVNILSQIRNGINSSSNNGNTTGKTSAAAATVRGKGATIADLEALKFGANAGGEESTEFAEAQVVN